MKVRVRVGVRVRVRIRVKVRVRVRVRVSTCPSARALRSPPVAPMKTSVGCGIPCCWVASSISEHTAVARDPALRASNASGSSDSSGLGGAK